MNEQDHFYFSQRELGLPVRSIGEIPTTVWNSLIDIITSELENGNFGSEFCENCPDGQGRIASSGSFWRRICADIPWFSDKRRLVQTRDEPPNTFYILDLIELCASHICNSTKGNFHSFYNHYHLDWSDEGRETALHDFVALINKWFATHGICFQLSKQGKIERILSSEQEHVITLPAYSKDDTLNKYIADAEQEFKKPIRDVEKANKDLWDAFERIKTLDGLNGKDKKGKIEDLIERLSKGNQRLGDSFNSHFISLTEIGNKFQIRHTETTQCEKLDENYAIYFFSSLLALIKLTIKELDL